MLCILDDTAVPVDLGQIRGLEWILVVISVVLLAVMVEHLTLQFALMLYLSTFTGYYCLIKLQSHISLVGKDHSEL